MKEIQEGQVTSPSKVNGTLRARTKGKLHIPSTDQGWRGINQIEVKDISKLKNKFNALDGLLTDSF